MILTLVSLILLMFLTLYYLNIWARKKKVKEYDTLYLQLTEWVDETFTSDKEKRWFTDVMDRCTLEIEKTYDINTFIRGRDIPFVGVHNELIKRLNELVITRVVKDKIEVDHNLIPDIVLYSYLSYILAKTNNKKLNENLSFIISDVKAVYKKIDEITHQMVLWLSIGVILEQSYYLVNKIPSLVLLAFAYKNSAVIVCYLIFIAILFGKSTLQDKELRRLEKQNHQLLSNIETIQKLRKDITK